MQEQPTFSLWLVVKRAIALLIGLALLPVIIVLAILSVTMSIIGIVIAETGKLLLVPVNDIACALFAPHQNTIFRVSGDNDIKEDAEDE
jgi:disulfide bond formation protein DsbB